MGRRKGDMRAAGREGNSSRNSYRSISILVSVVAIALGLCLCPAPALAIDANDYWIAATGNWSDANSWSNGVPGGASYARVDNGSTVTVSRNYQECVALYLGSAASQSGAITMTAETFGSIAQREYVGFAGTGLFTQSNGTNNFYGLYLGNNAGSYGVYNFSGTGRLSAQDAEYIGYSGTGLFTQDSGINFGSVEIGYLSGSSGTYHLSGTGLVTGTGGSYVTVGRSGNGLFIQDGGRNFPDSGLGLGSQAGASGTYQLSGGGYLMTQSEIIGFAGHGAFYQVDGNNEVVGDLYLGRDAGSSGTYQLSGHGFLTAINEWIGYDGNGIFTQDGGTNKVSRSVIIIGTGRYRLCGTGSLAILPTATGLTIGYSNGSAGRFEWFGGQFTTPNMWLGSKGTLALGLDFDASALADGSLYQGRAPELSPGTLEITNGATGVLASKSSLGPQTLQVGTTTGDGSFAQSDGNVTTSVLYLGQDPNARGSYELSGVGHLSVSGSEYLGYSGSGLFAQSGANHAVSGSLYLGYSSGSSGNYQLSGKAILSTAKEYLGYGGTGTFTQSDGNNTLTGTLYVGYSAASTGSYRLAGNGILTVGNGGTLRIGADSGAGRFEWFGGTLKTPTLTVGSSGALAMGFNFAIDSLLNGSLFQGSAPAFTTATLEITNGATATEANSTSLSVKTLQVGSSSGAGVFSQTAGSATASSCLFLGLQSGFSGTYQLGGKGILKDGNAHVGFSGTGLFAQSDGNHIVTSNLYVGTNAGSAGNYLLNGPGRLLAGTEYLGYSGTGAFTQSDGNHTVTYSLYLGYNSSSSSGTYQLSGTGRLAAGSEYVGRLGTGIFQQASGWNTAGYLSIGAKGQYALTGGTLTVKGRLDGNGVLDMSTGSGVMSISGPIKMGRTGEFDLSSGVLSAIDANLYVPIQNDGNFFVTSGAHRVDSVMPMDANVIRGVTRIDSGSALTAGSIRQRTLSVAGSLNVANLYVDGNGGSALSISGPSAVITVGNTLRFGPQGSLSAMPGSTIHMTGSIFQNQSADANAVAGLENLSLIYEAADASYDPFEVAGLDLGPDANGFVHNFGLGTLELGGPGGEGGPGGLGRVILVDLFDNQPGSLGAEALYLQSLVVNPGSELCLNGVNLYVGGTLVNPGDGAAYGGGDIYAAVPEPASLLLLALGGAALVRRQTGRMLRRR
jgi:hypothetical protein